MNPTYPSQSPDQFREIFFTQIANLNTRVVAMEQRLNSVEHKQVEYHAMMAGLNIRLMRMEEI